MFYSHYKSSFIIKGAFDFIKHYLVLFEIKKMLKSYQQTDKLLFIR
jgi:hypothetical protein